MPLDATAIIVETGSGNPVANSYTSLSDANAYFGQRLYADNWFNATPSNQVKALITAAFTLDKGFIWRGNKYIRLSNLAWPRTWVIDPDNTQAFFPQITRPNYLPANEIPARVIRAQTELALRCLGTFAQTQLTGNQPFSDQPLTGLKLGQGALDMTFEPMKTPAAGSIGLIDDEIAAILAGMGTRRHGNRGAVLRLRRGM
jgi:DnaT-like ssDNA binding protein